MDHALHPLHRCDPRLAHFLAMAGGRGPGRGGHRHGRRGGPPFGMPGFPGPRGRRAKRGDIRAALLVLLAEEPRNGYQLMQEVEQRSDGAWRPSPGSVYPALQQLEDEGLVRREEHDGQRLFHLTDAGREHVAERPADAPAPWDAFAEGVGDGQWSLQQEYRQLSMAFAQLLHGGSEAQQEAAAKQLADTRRALYGILAEDEAS
jgi:DNA-binding PadR family transcriptional regulator